jgi:hypothetical protein
MIITRKHMPRRTFLRGLAGATIALPVLDAMIPALTAETQTLAKGQFRATFVYTPHGVILDKWVPKTAGAGYEIMPILKPLEAHKDALIVLSNLAENKGKQAGAGHASSSATWLSAAVAKDSVTDVRAGTTIDQMIAKKIGQDTPVPSMELGIEDVSNMVGACDATSSCAYLNTMSWRNDTTPLPAEINPRIVFERMFGVAGTPQERLARINEDRSLLDDITASAKELQAVVGAQDKVRISDYLENVREIERRIAQVEKRNQDHELAVPDAPVAIPDLYEDHVSLMQDLQVVAFQADITRVTTFMMSRELNSRTYPQIGVPDQHHAVSHHQYNPVEMEKHQKINTYHVKLFNRFYEKLASTKDGNGSLLDQTMVLYGSGMGDGNVHSHDPISVILTGGGMGRIKGGKHIRNEDHTPMGNLLLAMLEIAGIQLDSIGDSTGKINLNV